MDKRYKISELFPDVEQIDIEYKLEYKHFVGTKVKNGQALYKPNFAAEFYFKCLNVDCTGCGFDLYSEVASAILHETTVRGLKQCGGKEARDYPNCQCPCTMEYVIHVVYRKDSRR